MKLHFTRIGSHFQLKKLFQPYLELHQYLLILIHLIWFLIIFLNEIFINFYIFIYCFLIYFFQVHI